MPQMSEDRWETWDSAVNHPAGVGRLRPAQIAHRSTWAGVPDKDMAVDAMHIVRVVPADGYTIAWVNELDPGISGESVGEGTGWFDRPPYDGRVCIHGKGMR